MSLDHLTPLDHLGPPAGLEGGWTPVCPAGRIPADTGVAALVGPVQVAVFRLADGRVLAVDNHDPASGANVLARGIVGDRAGRPVVASPVYKQRFDLETGECLDDPSLRVGTHQVRLVDGVVQVRDARAATGPITITHGPGSGAHRRASAASVQRLTA